MDPAGIARPEVRVNLMQFVPLKTAPTGKNWRIPMTSGEKMIWAAAWVDALNSGLDPYKSAASAMLTVESARSELERLEEYVDGCRVKNFLKEMLND
jgi:hypothetical protein